MEKDKIEEMAERAAEKAYPPNVVKTISGDFDFNEYGRIIFWRGYKQALEDVVGEIEERIGEILGDAQPAPVLRMELHDMVSRIEGGGGKNL